MVAVTHAVQHIYDDGCAIRTCVLQLKSHRRLAVPCSSASPFASLGATVVLSLTMENMK